VNPELQTMVARIELLERQSGLSKTISVLSLAVAVGAAAMVWLQASRTPVPTDPVARFSSVEANRFILRDLESRAVGGLEVDRNGTIRLVLGRSGATGAVVLEAQQNGVAHLTLRDPAGAIRAGLVASDQPSLALGGKPDAPAVTLLARSDGSGRIEVHDAKGKVRFRAP
jgi:hypothetical protein